MITGSPLFSIITVTYNAGPAIHKTIDSVQGQSFRNFEHIIVDGQSTDDTLAIIRAYGDKISRLVSEPDQGIYDAMNKGLLLARGEWVIFLNAGDYFYSPDTLAGLEKYLREDGDIVYSNFVCDYGGFRKTIGTPGEQALPAAISRGMCLCHNAMVFRTSQHRKKLYDKRFRIAADYDVILTLVHAGARVMKFPEPIAVIETGSGVSYRRQIASLREHRQVMKMQRSGFAPLFWNMLALMRAMISTAAKAFLPTRIVDWVIRYK